MEHDDYISEGYAIGFEHEGEEEEVEEKFERLRDENQRHRLKRSSSPTKKYLTAKQASTGSTVVCPVCGKTFKKKSYQQAFCSNKGRGNCKDKYWNQ